MATNVSVVKYRIAVFSRLVQYLEHGYSRPVVQLLVLVLHLLDVELVCNKLLAQLIVILLLY
jgi:hypothetical protein